MAGRPPKRDLLGEAREIERRAYEAAEQSAVRSGVVVTPLDLYRPGYDFEARRSRRRRASKIQLKATELSGGRTTFRASTASPARLKKSF